MQHVACNIVGSCCNMLSRVGQTNTTLCNMVTKRTQHFACNNVVPTCCIRLARAFGSTSSKRTNQMKQHEGLGYDGRKAGFLQWRHFCFPRLLSAPLPCEVAPHYKHLFYRCCATSTAGADVSPSEPHWFTSVLQVHPGDGEGLGAAGSRASGPTSSG